MNSVVVELGRSAFNGASEIVCELSYATAARMASDAELAAIFPGITLTERSLDYAQSVESTDLDEDTTEELLFLLLKEHGWEVLAEVGCRLEEFTQGMVDLFGRRGTLQ